MTKRNELFQIAVCDDDPRQVKAILSLLSRYQAERPGLAPQARGFLSGDDLLDALEDGGFDLYLLDIIMPGQNGIELAREIRAREPDAAIVFLTSTAEYALEAFDLFAVTYMLKPLEQEKLFLALDKVAARLGREEEPFLLFSAQTKAVKIPFSSIVCVELYNRSLRLFHENGEVLVSKTIRTPFEVSVAPLLEDGRFLSAHKSYILNMEHVETLTPSAFVLKRDLSVPVPRYRYAEAKTRYFAWLSARGCGVIGGVR